MPSNRPIGYRNCPVDIGVQEVTHTVDGTLVRAEILEVEPRFFRAKIVEPFEKVIERGVVKWADVHYVVDMQLTQNFFFFIRKDMEKHFREWAEQEEERRHFLANLDALKALAIRSHASAIEENVALDLILEEMQLLGESMDTELAQIRKEFRSALKSGLIVQGEYQSRLRDLRKSGPNTATWDSKRIKAERLYQQYQFHAEVLTGILDSFHRNARIGLSHAASLLELEELPRDGAVHLDPTDLLKGLSVEVSQVFSSHRRNTPPPCEATKPWRT